MTFKSLLAVAVALMLIVSWTVIRDKETLPVFNKTEEMIMMRNIGHQVLLYAGDSTSRVLPVQEIADHEYLIQFGSQFTFVPDSLVKVIDRMVKAHHLPPTYMVQVIACTGNEVIFGYSMHKDSTNNIVPCLGRDQVKACYKIKLLFPTTSTSSSTDYLLTGSLLAICLSLLVRSLYNKRRKAALATEATNGDSAPPTPAAEPSNAVSIGRYLFYTDKQILSLEGQVIPLTAKESKLLQVFAATPNEVIDRDRLLKEVWEDEGVIVGRSLDMFVSKLRKKLQKDPGISIINIHGKGYKLAIGA